MDPHHVDAYQDADPDLTYHSDADPDPNYDFFYLMLIWIRLFTLMWIRIQILASKKIA